MTTENHKPTNSPQSWPELVENGQVFLRAYREEFGYPPQRVIENADRTVSTCTSDGTPVQAVYRTAYNALAAMKVGADYGPAFAAEIVVKWLSEVMLAALREINENEEVTP